MTHPPTRLIDDDAIEPELKEALGQIGVTKVPFDVEAGVSQLREAITHGAPATPEPSWFVKHKLWVLAGGGAGLIGGAALLAISSREPTPAPPRPAATAEVAAPAPVATPSPSPPEPGPSPASTTVETAQPGVPAPSASARAQRPTLAEEVRQLAEVRALSARDPAGAARKADEGHRRFSGGMLYQEREAVAITSLSRAGQSAEARARAGRFLAQFPKSPFADQVRALAPAAP